MKEFLSSPEFKENEETRYEKSFEKLQSDIEDEKVGFHFTNFSNSVQILENGIFSSLDLKQESEKSNKDRLYTGAQGQVLQETFSMGAKLMVDRIIKFSATFGSNWDKDELIEQINELEAFGGKKIGEYKKESPRFEYFIDNVVPKLVEEAKKYDYLYHEALRDKSKSTYDKSFSENLNSPKNIYAKNKHFLPIQFFGEGMISTIPPEVTKEIFNKKRSDVFFKNDIGILFDSPDKVRTNYFYEPNKGDNGEYEYETKDGGKSPFDTGDLGVSSKIKPFRFRGMLLLSSLYNKDSNTINLNIKLDKHDLEVINQDKESESSSEYAKEFLKEILKFQKDKMLPIFDKEYNHVPVLDSVMININLKLDTGERHHNSESGKLVEENSEKILLKGSELLK